MKFLDRSRKDCSPLLLLSSSRAAAADLLQAATSASHGSPSHYCFHPLDGGRCQVLEWLLFFFAAGGRQCAAMDFPLDPVSSLPIIYGACPAEATLEILQGGDSVSSNAGPAAAACVAMIGDLLEGTSVGDAASGLGGVDGPEPAASAESTEHGNPQSPGWTKRVRVGRAPPDRTHCAERQNALEKPVRCFAEKLGEAYDFYNLYSWEHGFRIRYGKSRLNSEKTKCMQEIVCCSGKPTSENVLPLRMPCDVRLLRSADNDSVMGVLRSTTSQLGDGPESCRRGTGSSTRRSRMLRKDMATTIHLMACMVKRRRLCLRMAKHLLSGATNPQRMRNKMLCRARQLSSVSNCVQGCVFLVPRQCRLLACA